MSKVRKKEIGAFYTPAQVIDYMLEKTLAQADPLERPFLRVLDPACGCGYFLVRAYERLLTLFSERSDALRERYAQERYVYAEEGRNICLSGDEYWRREYLPYHILTHCLYGIDIDGEAVAIAARELMRLAGGSFAPRLAVADSLLPEDNGFHPYLSQRYDYVVGNPPYVSFGLRGVQTLERQRYDRLAQAYPHSAEYKLSLYALFFERGIALLKDGGQLAYITPDSFLTGRYFSKLRNFLSQYEVKSITLLLFPVFAGAAIGNGVITVVNKKASDGEEGLICAEAASSSRQLATGDLSGRFQYSQQYFKPDFALFFSREELEICRTLREAGKRIGNYYGLYSGCIARFGQKSIISDTPSESHIIYDRQGNLVLQDIEAGARWRRLIGKGAYIGQYQMAPSPRYIYVHEDEAVRRIYAKSGFDLKKYEQEKLFLRQTGETLIAAYDNEGYYCLNNMHVIYAKGTEHSIKLLLALLNSRLYEWYYRCITRETGRVLPQVDIDTVRNMPLLDVFNSEKLLSLTDGLLAAYRTDRQSRQERKRRRDIRSELEEAILDNLDLSSGTRELILSTGKKTTVL